MMHKVWPLFVCVAAFALTVSSVDARRANVESVVARMLHTHHDAPTSNSLNPTSTASQQTPPPVASKPPTTTESLSTENPVPTQKGPNLMVLHNINKMNGQLPSHKAYDALVLISEQQTKDKQEARRKKALENLAEIKWEATAKRNRLDAAAQGAVLEESRKKTIAEESSKAQGQATANLIEQNQKAKQLAEEQNDKKTAAEAEQTQKKAEAQQKSVTAELNTKQAAEQKAKADQAATVKKEESTKSAAAAAEQQQKAANVAAEQSDKKKQEQLGKAQALQAQTAAEATIKNEQTQKSKFIVKVGSFQVSPGNVLSALIPATSAYTLMFWYKPLNQTTGQSGTFTIVIQHGSDDFSRGPAVYMFPSSSRLHICSAGKTTAQWNQCVDPDPTPTDWTHVAIAHGSSGLTVYYNAQQAAQLVDNGPGPIMGPLAACPNFSNQTTTSGGVAAPAQLADVRWFPSVVTQSDIASVYSMKQYQ